MIIVLCHGVFDILHVGHVRHLEQARTFGNYLVVSVTDDPFVNKGPGRPINPLEDRMQCLRALRCVDLVISSRFPSALDNIGKIRPAYYCKGIDYADKGLRDAEMAACLLVGAEVRFTTTPKTSVTEILRKCAFV